jgi:hypothetical protein
MMFRPHVPRVRRSREVQPMSGGPQFAQQAPEPLGIVIPTSLAVDLRVGTGPGDPTVWQFDCFLLIPRESSFQSLLIGADRDIDTPSLSYQLIQRKGQETEFLAPAVTLNKLRVAPIRNIDPVPWFEGPVFLRLRFQYVAANLLLTLESLTSEVF